MSKGYVQKSKDIIIDTIKSTKTTYSSDKIESLLSQATGDMIKTNKVLTETRVGNIQIVNKIDITGAEPIALYINELIYDTNNIIGRIVEINIDEDGEQVSIEIVSAGSGNAAISEQDNNALIHSEEDDKLYVKDLEPQLKELQTIKYPNATQVGFPSVNNGQVSGFSNNNYYQFPFIVDFKGRPFIINTEFTTSADVTTQQNIFDSDFGFAFAIRSARFVIAMSSNGENWNLGESIGTYAVRPNTTYKVRLSWNGNIYKVEYSIDNGETYITDITKDSTASLYPKQIYIGVGENFGSVMNYFKGSINFNHCDLTIGDNLIWQGMDNVGLSTRMARDASNIDEAGKEKIKEIVGVDWQGKNLIPFPYTSGMSKTIRGITFTVNNDGSVTANGTATEVAYFTVLSPLVLKNGKTYTLSGCPSGGSMDTYGVKLRSAQYDLGDGLTFVADDSVTDYAVDIRIAPGATVNNLTFYPMLEAGSTAHAYEPTPQSNVSLAKGDIYSTEEIIVGTWVDGKPIYRKVVAIEKSGTALNGMNLSNIGLNNIKEFIHFDMYGRDTSSGNRWLLSSCNAERPVWFNGNFTIIYTLATAERYFISCIAEYTKTTD